MGQGTPVTVSSDNPSAPTLFPLVSCESTDDSLVALGCLARDFLPSTINFSWNFKNNSEVGSHNVQTFPSVQSQGRYMASSQLLLPSVNLLPGSDDFLVCNAKHPQGERRLNVQIPGVGELPPNVSIFIPPRDAFSSSGAGPRTSQLICQATGFSPKKVSVSWLREGKPLKVGIDTGTVETEPKGAGPQTFRITSRLTITESDWLSQNVFTCRVEHLGLHYQKNVSSVCGPAAPTTIRVFTVPPSFAGMFLNKMAKLTCLVTDLVTYDSLNISWAHDGGDKLKTSFKVSDSHLNGTFSAVGEASIFVEDWKSGRKFTCTVIHKDLPAPLKHTISYSNEGVKHPPSVYILPPAKEQLHLRESASVTCLMNNFSPADLFVQWQHKGQPVSPDKYVTSAPMPEPQAPGLYFSYSVLTVSEEEWNAGDTFTCVVGHEELPHSVTERTVDKTTGKPTLYNVSLILSDTAGICY